MTGFGFPMLVCLCFMLCPCVGKITCPTNATSKIFCSGSTENITWIFDDASSSLYSRNWFLNGQKLGLIKRHDSPQPRNKLGIKIVKPATLTLTKVNQSHNGIYTFTIQTTATTHYSPNVTVFIAEKPNATLSCSSPITLNEGDDFTCVCTYVGEGGNPPANVTWFKDDVKINGTGSVKNILTLSNVNERSSGRYTCLAQNYNHSKCEDRKAIKVQVNQRSTHSGGGDGFNTGVTVAIFIGAVVALFAYFMPQ